MITANWSKVAAIFDAIVDLDETQRQAYLLEACGSDEMLRHEVEAMLAADADASRFFTTPILGRRIPIGTELAPADRIGPYEIEELIGRGGMGAVYRARRVQDFDRTVAIKVIDRLIPDKATLRRFFRERQILSSLDHPNIARLFDGGLTETGMPYIVMEYVDGVPIDEYCRVNELGLTERLDLFRQVCGAVAHAHRHLVIHRDLKPGNILVSQDRVVKLLDFGIARHDSLPDETSITRTHEVVATPRFASPEQLSGLNVSTSWDVFALGRVLELVTTDLGKTPSGYRPSFGERLKQTECRQDLASIVARATSPAESERYESVRELTSDIECVIEDRPVSTRQLNRRVALLRFARKRVPMLLSLIAFTATSLVLVSLVIMTRNDATSRTTIARGLSSYLVSLIKVMDPDTRSDNVISAQEVLDLGTNQARANLPLNSPEYVQIIREIGGMYLKVGAFRQAQNLLSEVLGTSVPMDQRFVAGANLELARVLHAQGSNEDAEVHLLRSLDMLPDSRGVDAPAYADVLEELASVAVDMNRLKRADSLGDICLEIRRRSFGANSHEVASSIGLKARILWRAREYEDAERLYRSALIVEKAVSGSRTLNVASILNDLGLVYVDMGLHSKAEQLLDEALEIKRSILGSNHPSFATSLANLAPVVRDRFGPDSAEALMRRVVEINIDHFGVEHHEVATAKNNLALYLIESGKLEEARKEFQEAVDIWRSTVGPVHPDYITGNHNLAIVLRKRGDFRAAIQYYEVAADGFRNLGPNYRVSLASALVGLATSYLQMGALAEAAASFRECLAIREEELPAGHWRIGTAKSLLGETLALLGERDEAEPLLRSGYEILRAARGPDDVKTLEALRRLEDLNLNLIVHAGGDERDI